MVEFYNSKHENVLRSRSSYKNILKIIESGLTVDDDLWIYCLFKEQRNRDGFRTYEDFASRLTKRIQLLEDYIDLNSNTISAIDEKPDKIISEYIGVGCGLKLISEIHGLTEADWELIPESKTKDLDFQISSDGKTIIEVECKGTFNGSTRSNMMSSIEAKKEVQRNEQNNNHILYGVIASYYFGDSKPARADILDPEPLELYSDPYLVRLLNRLKYYLTQFNVFSRAHFLISLSERINVLKHTKNYNELDGLPLINQYGEPFEFPVSFDWKKPLRKHDDIIGNIFFVSEKDYLFFGINQNIVNLLIRQDHSAILDYREKAEMFSVSDEIQISPEQKLEKENETFFVEGVVHQNTAGLVFGVLNRF